MNITSSYANKLIRQYDDEIGHLMQLESDNMTYVEIVGQSEKCKPWIIPDYSFEETRQEILALQEKIRRIKHALNVFNATTTIPEIGITIDEALVKMAQLNRLKERYRTLREIPEKKLSRSGIGTNSSVGYVCRNFDPNPVDEAYNTVTKEIQDIQMGLDLINNTKPISVDI